MDKKNKVKKIGILTFPHSPSFGASLQMTGLYYAVKELGHNPIIINYMNQYMKRNKHISNFNNSILRRSFSWLSSLQSKIKFSEFEKNLLFEPKKISSDKNKIVSVSRDFDKIICGSDQVWNPQIIGNDWTYFLDFCQGDKRISYAPSFGITQLPSEHKEVIGKELSLFGSISVREKQAQPIVSEFTNVIPPVVLDPTMLHTSEFWNKMEKKPKAIDSNKPYIACFVFHPNNNTFSFMDEIQKETGVPILRYSWSIKKILQDRKSIGGMGPAEWLWYIRNAEYVITDSFHGTVFSILFKKKFFVSLTATTNSRLLNLLNLFRLDNRIISVDRTNWNYFENIDYSEVEKKLSELKNESVNFLKNAILK